MRQPMFALLLSVPLAACAGEGGTNDPVEDDGDGAGDGTDDGTGDEWEDPVRPEACPSGAMGAVASLTDPEAYNDPLEEAEDGPRVRYLWGGVNDTTGFEIDLYDGYGAFMETPAAPGTFTIGGADADPIDCGLCVYLWIDTDEWSYSLQATGGTVTIETLDGKLKGTASGLTFTELSDVDEGYMEGGCSATIDSVPFDATYYVEEEEPPA